VAGAAGGVVGKDLHALATHSGNTSALPRALDGAIHHKITINGDGAMTIKIDKFSLAELKTLQSDVAKAIANFEGRRRAEALEAIVATAKAQGFTLAVLLGSKPSRKRTPVAPKFAHPENKSITWSGRGRKPKWVEAALESGQMLSNLLI
jgi:DNA-binding protein H-NS